MCKVTDFIFGNLYQRWFGDGQAYYSPLHYTIADIFKILAGWPYRPPDTARSRLVDLLENLRLLVTFLCRKLEEKC